MGGQEVWLYSFLTLVLDTVDWSVSRLDCFTTKNELRYRLNRRLRGRQSRRSRFGEDKNEDESLPRLDVTWGRRPVTKFRGRLLPSCFRIKKTRRAVNLRDPRKKELVDRPSIGRYREAMTVQPKQSTTVGGK